MSKSILYIEDNDANATMIQVILKREGIPVLIAKDGNTGVQLAIDHEPVLIICDYHLPGLFKGPEVVETIRHTPRIAETPILMLTADTTTYPKSMESGADGYLNKPINRDQLLESIHKLLR